MNSNSNSSNSGSESIVYLANLTDKEIEERLNIRIQNTEQERKANLAEMACHKQTLELLANECVCKTKLLNLIKHFKTENAVLVLEIDLLSNHRQALEQQEKSFTNETQYYCLFQNIYKLSNS